MKKPKKNYFQVRFGYELLGELKNKAKIEGDKKGEKALSDFMAHIEKDYFLNPQDFSFELLPPTKAMKELDKNIKQIKEGADKLLNG
jgi:hypothetical protein